jgi:hypothetical protein
MAFEDYYNNNPISVLDQNTWDERLAQVAMNFQVGPTVYTPLIDYVNYSQQSGAQQTYITDLLEGDVDNDEISTTAAYIAEPAGIDSRQRKLTVARYGDKVQYSKFSTPFNMWKMSGGRDWRPLLRSVLGNNVQRKYEVLARNAFLKGPQSFWTYAGSATDFSELNADTKFSLAAVNGWRLRLGNSPTPLITGETAKIAILPPGAIYDFQESLAGASTNEGSMFRDASLYQGKLQYEVGTYKGIRFVECPSDRYGQNMAVLYNAGPVVIQAEVTDAIARGDGCPDPESDQVDDVWYTGQKDVTHYIQLADDTDMSAFEVNDMVSLHTVRTSAFGVTNGCDFRSGKTIVRRIVDIDEGNYRISFDRPVMKPYDTEVDTGVYAWVTKGTHVGFVLVAGGRGGIVANVNQPLAFYEPVAVDDFQSVYRFVYDFWQGYNVWEPSLFECHFCAVTLPKPGGVILPPEAEISS